MKFLFFSANFCNPCKQLAPIMERISKQGISVQKIDIEQDEDTTSEWGIRSVPTVILVSGGGFELNRTVGVQPESFYVNLYNKHKNNLV